MLTYAAFAIVFVLGLSVAALVTPITMYISHRFDVVDRPGGRRKGHGEVGRLGGVAIFAGFVVAAVVAQWLPVPRFDPMEAIRFIGLVGGLTIIFVAGLMDDLFEFGPIPQFVAQLLAAGVAILFQIFIQTVNNPLSGDQVSWAEMHWVTVTITLVWMVLMMNTVNFLDGLDGLASGVTLIAGLMLFAHSAFRLSPPQLSVSLLPLALTGACLGFLLYNFNPAQVFMGSSGSYVLGYALATLSIIGGAKMASILLVMGLPLLDVVWQVANRIRLGRNPMRGDRGHLHFRLIDAGIPQRQIVLAYYLFCGAFGTLALMTTSRFYKLVALALMSLIVVAGFWGVGRLRSRLRRVQSQG
jgi:UDP-GlcNAc:undecaprenyl-phosphate/decaprenyl-phosphate GlcNAc-1-phosphate transferase